MPSSSLVDRTSVSSDSELRVIEVSPFDLDGFDILPLSPLKSTDIKSFDAETSSQHDSCRCSSIHYAEPSSWIDNASPAIPIRAQTEERLLNGQDPSIRGCGVASTQDSTVICCSSSPSRHLRQPSDSSNYEVRPLSVENYHPVDKVDSNTYGQRWVVDVNAADQGRIFSDNIGAIFAENRDFQTRILSQTSGVDAPIRLLQGGPIEYQSPSLTKFGSFDSLFAHQHEVEDWEAPDLRNKATGPWAGPLKTNAALRRGCLQISCFIDDCCGKDNYISELMYGTKCSTT